METFHENCEKIHGFAFGSTSSTFQCFTFCEKKIILYIAAVYKNFYVCMSECLYVRRKLALWPLTNEFASNAQIQRFTENRLFVLMNHSYVAELRFLT